MDLHRREWAAKVKLIHAIARSQGALSRILDSVADVAAHDSPSKELAKKLVGNIQVLTRYQNGLCRMATGKSFIRRYKKGTPTKPWTNTVFIRTLNVTRGVQEENTYGQDGKNQKKSAEEKREIKKSKTSFAQKKAQAPV